MKGDTNALPSYVPVERPDVLVRCTPCGALVEGSVVSQAKHDTWHKSLDRRIGAAARWRLAPKYGRTS